MNDMDDPTNPTAAALRDFGTATSNLLAQWLRTLQAEHFEAIAALIERGARLGVRFMSATTTKPPILVVLLADPAGDFHVVGEVNFERDTVQ